MVGAASPAVNGGSGCCVKQPAESATPPRRPPSPAKAGFQYKLRGSGVGSRATERRTRYPTRWLAPRLQQLLLELGDTAAAYRRGNG